MALVFQKGGNTMKRPHLTLVIVARSENTHKSYPQLKTLVILVSLEFQCSAFTSGLLGAEAYQRSNRVQAG